MYFESSTCRDFEGRSFKLLERSKLTFLNSRVAYLVGHVIIVQINLERGAKRLQLLRKDVSANTQKSLIVKLIPDFT